MLIIDPVILPAGNNQKSLPFEMLEDAFPEIKWAQPRNNRRGILITRKYMTTPFAEELSAWVACPAEQDRLLPQEFVVSVTRKECWADARIRLADC